MSIVSSYAGRRRFAARVRRVTKTAVPKVTASPGIGALPCLMSFVCRSGRWEDGEAGVQCCARLLPASHLQGGEEPEEQQEVHHAGRAEERRALHQQVNKLKHVCFSNHKSWWENNQVM